MTWENKSGIDVYDHYGPRVTGGGLGQNPSVGQTREVKIDFNGELHPALDVIIPKGSTVIDYKPYGVVGTAVVSVGSEGITACSISDKGTYVDITTDSKVNYSGATGGYIVFQYRYM
jgi:hypothetical protein